MAKLQGWKRRDGAADAPVDVSEESPVEEPLGDPVEPVDEPGAPASRPRSRLSILDSTPVLLLQAAHPRQALVTGLGLGVVALAADRAPREAAVVAATALVGQVVLGWHNDLVDRDTDARHDAPRKPLADGRLDPGTAWYALVIALLLVVPLSITTGVTAGLFYLGSLVVGLVGNVVLRHGRLSWLTWAVQFALYAPYVALGGWGGDAKGDPPEVAMVVLFALLGVGVHVLRAIWGLVADDAEGWTYLPLALGRRIGATRLLVVAAAYLAVVLATMVVVGATVGLRQ
jgi:4-hydroxybenzoate polyprenyltransferase